MIASEKYQRLSQLDLERAHLRERNREINRKLREARKEEAESATAPQPVSASQRSQNKLRPNALDEVIGQEEAREMMRHVIDACLSRDEPMDHALLVGPAGTGKTTFAHVIANELGRDCYQIAAPVSLDSLMQFRTVMKDGDILFVDEIHQQAIMERRGKEAATQPEVFLSLLEDSVIATSQGMLPFPRITVIGATTDPGRLPDPFLDRFPIQPRLASYSERELEVMAEANARQLGLTLMPGVALMFAKAARATPRTLNNYMRNAASLVGPDAYVVEQMAERVLGKLNGVTSDGLTREMQGMLCFLYERCERHMTNGEIRYQASVNTIATAIGLSRDTKAIQLRIEPYLIQRGYIQLGSGGRQLTDAGIWRARDLQKGK